MCLRQLLVIHSNDAVSPETTVTGDLLWCEFESCEEVIRGTSLVL